MLDPLWEECSLPCSSELLPARAHLPETRADAFTILRQTLPTLRKRGAGYSACGWKRETFRRLKQKLLVVNSASVAS